MSKNKIKDNLPSCGEWKCATLSDVLSTLKNGFNCKQDKHGIGDRVSRIESISSGLFNLDRVGFTSIPDKEKDSFRLRLGDILFSHINSPIHVGKTAVFDLKEEVYHGVNLLLMRPTKVISPKYLSHFLNFLYLKGYWKGICKQSVNQASVNQQDIGRVSIMFPLDISEQERIVAILDEAFEGIATAKANTEDSLRSARDIFVNYLNSLRGTKTILGAFVQVRTGKLDANAAVENGQYPFFTCSREASAINSYAFECDAILLAGNNAVGDFNVKHYTGKFNAYQRTYVITVENQNILASRYLYYQILKSMKSFKEQSVGVGTKFLKIGMINNLKIVLPSIGEQKEIVGILDCLLDATSKLEFEYEKKLSALEALKQSLLHQAFSGNL